MTWPSTPSELLHRDQYHATFQFHVIPDFNLGKSSKPNVRKVSFQEAGAEQRLRFGLYTDLKTYELAWTARSDQEADFIEAFFESKAAVDSFSWREPNKSLADQTDGNGDPIKKWVCEEWSRTYVSYDNNSIQAVFREVAE